MGGNYGKCLVKFRIYFKEFHSDTEVEGTEFFLLIRKIQYLQYLKVSYSKPRLKDPACHNFIRKLPRVIFGERYLMHYYLSY